MPRLLAFALLPLLGCAAFDGPSWRGPVTDHFDGRRFQNDEPGSRTFGDVLRWQLGEREVGDWPDWVEIAPQPPPPERVGRGELRITWVNHATLLVQLDGVNVLTDPVWSERVGPFSWVGPRRRHAPGVAFDDLPPIDLVVVSHNHYDHLDLPTLQALAERHDPLFLVGLGNRGLLLDAGILRVIELDWWQSVGRRSVTATFVPARHTSMRGLSDQAETLWGGWVLSGPGGPVYFAGDTGFGPHFARIRERLGPMRAALLPIGAYLPRWFMEVVHIGPVEAVEAARILEAELSVPMHHFTFDQSDESQEQPLLELQAELAKGSPHFAFPAPGEAVVVAVGAGR